ncbi:MAG TPA: response regulator, partial [Paracoccaceae bacterium]
MQMRKHVILIVSTGQSGAGVIDEMLARMPHFRTETASVDDVMQYPKRYAPDLVVLDIAAVTATELDVLMAMRANHGDVPVLVVSEALDDGDMRKLLKLKIHDWLRKPLVFGDFQNAIQSGIRNAKQSSNRVHAVISAVGGAGATTVAVSLADILAKKLGRSSGSVGLFDLDFSSGACGYLLNMSNSFSLDSVITNPSRIDGEFVNLIQQKHDHGFSVYSFKRRDIVTHLNSYELVLRLLDAVTMQHSHT